VDFYQHAKDIYDAPQWPKEPLFYANFQLIKLLPGRNGIRFFLVPLAPGINDSEELERSTLIK
jgi:phytoene desaturase